MMVLLRGTFLWRVIWRLGCVQPCCLARVLGHLSPPEHIPRFPLSLASNISPFAAKLCWQNSLQYQIRPFYWPSDPEGSLTVQKRPFLFLVSDLFFYFCSKGSFFLPCSLFWLPFVSPLLRWDWGGDICVLFREWLFFAAVHFLKSCSFTCSSSAKLFF